MDPAAPIAERESQAAVAFDATPLSVPPEAVTSHTMRGIGRYIRGLLDALVVEQPEWTARRLRPVIAAGGAPEIARPIVTRRVRWRAQDLGWWTAPMLDRAAIAGQGIGLWHALDPNLPLSPLPASRTIMTAYDLIALHEPVAMAQIRPHRRAVYRLYLRRLARTRLVIAISEVTADDVRRTLNVPAARVRVVYPAVAAPAGGIEPGSGDGSPDLLFVGVAEPTKQPELAIEGLAELRRRGQAVRLRFAGYQRPADRERLLALARARGVGGAVDFLGRISESRLVELYRSSVLLAPSRIEGFGLPPLEAVLAGGRAVAGPAPVYREVLGSAADYLPRRDGSGVADAYDAAVSRSPTGPPIDLIERFSPRATADALVAAYESLG